MEAPPRIFPVIEYEKATLSPWPDVFRMMGTIAIALGAVLALNAGLSLMDVSNLPYRRWTAVYGFRFPWYPLAELLTILLSLLLLLGGIGCRCLNGWGRMLLIIWACLAPVGCAGLLVSWRLWFWRGATIAATSQWVSLGASFVGQWLNFCLFPLIILLLLRPAGNWKKNTSGGPTPAPPFQKVIRAIGIVGTAMATMTCIYLPLFLWDDLHSKIPHQYMLRIKISLVCAAAFAILLLTASIACWRLKASGRWLFIVYAILCMVSAAAWNLAQPRLPLNFPAMGMRLARTMMSAAPFPLVIILLMWRQPIRAVFSPPTS